MNYPHVAIWLLGASLGFIITGTMFGLAVGTAIGSGITIATHFIRK